MEEKYYYYFAYGMNTNEEQMLIRCPNAIAIGAASLPNHRFDFKTHATVTPCKTETTHGVLWMITDIDEQSLDVLEGFPHYYLKKVVKVKINGKFLDAMTYYIPGQESSFPPSESYYNLVLEGYKKFLVPNQQLIVAKKRAELKTYKRTWHYSIDKNYIL